MTTASVIWCTLARALSHGVPTVSDTVVFGGGVLIAPSIDISDRGGGLMILDTGSTHSWMSTYESLSSAGYSRMGGIRNDTSMIPAAAPPGTGAIEYADSDRVVCGDWILSEFQLGERKWVQQLCIPTHVHLNHPPISAGLIGASPDSWFASSVGPFGILPGFEEFGLIFFHEMNEAICPSQGILHILLIHLSRHWMVSTLVSIGSVRFHSPTLLDTGASAIVLPDEMYEAFLKEIADIPLLYESSEPLRSSVMECRYAPRLPSLHLQFSSSPHIIHIRPALYLARISHRACAIRITRGMSTLQGVVLLGKIFMQHYPTVFDPVKRQISICAKDTVILPPSNQKRKSTGKLDARIFMVICVILSFI